MNYIKNISLLLAILISSTTQAQDSNKKVSTSFGVGYFGALLNDEGISFPDAEYAPEVGAGFSYFLSFDYGLTENLFLGLGYNGNYASAKYIKNAIIGDNQITGYLSAGAVANSNIMLNITYSPQTEGVQPYGKLGIGYFTEQVELGDVPLSLTNNVEFELFPDYKSKGLGILPEIGAKYNAFSLSVGYGLAFTELTGEVIPDAYTSTGTITSHGLQVNVAYRLFLF